ncbi:MAG: Uxx-star family glutaredoxin-like (seleno)protein [Methanocella sp.]
MPKVVVYGKPGCPYTSAAREDLEQRGVRYEYHDVQAEPQAFADMVALTGDRRVPVIVEEGRVTVGFGGGT